jgi:16S rRNA G966 N2-methylase RsmD
LCAGTGAVGIEAVSRGAGFATFVDKSNRACALIEENLDMLAIRKNKPKFSEVHPKNLSRATIRQLGTLFFTIRRIRKITAAFCLSLQRTSQNC